MKTWKNAELVELNINETAWGVFCSDKERGIIVGTHDCEDFGHGKDDGSDKSDNSVTPDTLS